MERAFNANYLDSLVGADRDRYLNKIKLCGEDPYELEFNLLKNEIELLPEVTHGDIVQYLVFSTNAVSVEQMRSFKSRLGGRSSS